MLDGISRIIYKHELNSVFVNNKKELNFLDNMPIETIHHFLKVVLENIVIKEGSDLHLCACLGGKGAVSALCEPEDGHSILDYLKPHLGNFSLVIFPDSGKVKSYALNPKSLFLSNVHQNPDILLVSHLEAGIYIDDEIGKDYIFFGRCRDGLPNKINSGLLLKKNIKEYSHFEEYLKYYEKIKGR